MTRTHYLIAMQIRRRIGAHANLIGTDVTQTEYLRVQAESDRAEQMARYLTTHLSGIDRAAFAAMCGIPSFWRNA